MKIIKLTKERYSDWNNFCLNSNDAWFWHTTNWLEYIINFQSKPEKQNFSFFIEDNNQLKAIVPLIIENKELEKGYSRELCFSGWTTPAPALNNFLSSEEEKLICQLIFKEIDQIAKKEKVSLIRFSQTPLSINSLNKKLSSSLSEAFATFEYSDLPASSQTINLQKNINELWKNLRRNHRRLIKKGDGIKIYFFNSQNISPHIFQNYEEMHYKAANKKTRSPQTFKLMYEWIKNNLGFLAIAELEGKKVGFEYFSIYKNNVYASSIAKDPQCQDLTIRHLLEWESILWMKKQGFYFYEVGHQPYWSPNKKQINISLFKKGFGGLLVPLFIKEKKY